MTFANEVQPLPRGRHTLSREEVVSSQRERLQRALAEAMAEKGYAGTSVADVLRRAHVSRETFYEQFSSKEDCFMSVFDEAYARLVSAVLELPAVEGREPLDWFEAVLGAYLGTLAGDPAYARAYLIEVYAAGPEALRRRAELQRQLVAALNAGMGATGERRFATEAFVAAVSALVTARLAEDDVAGLRALHAPLIALARKAWAS